MSKEFIVNSDRAFGEVISWINDLYQKKKWVSLTANTGKKRTPSQNNAIHKYCRMVADELNEKHISAYIDSPILKTPIETDWTMEMVKEIWRSVQGQMFPQKERSTAALNRDEVNAIYDVVHRAFIEKTEGMVAVMFPSREVEDNVKHKVVSIMR